MLCCYSNIELQKYSLLSFTKNENSRIKIFHHKTLNINQILLYNFIIIFTQKQQKKEHRCEIAFMDLKEYGKSTPHKIVRRAFAYIFLFTANSALPAAIPRACRLHNANSFRLPQAVLHCKNARFSLNHCSCF